MARANVSEQQVNEAAEALLRQGQNVTVPAVRTFIGRGSYSTINTYLATWRKTNNGTKSTDAPEIPEGIVRAMDKIWETAWQESQDRICNEREALAAAKREMEREKRDLTQEIVRLEAELQVQTDALTQQNQAFAEAQQSAKKHRSSSAGAKDRKRASGRTRQSVRTARR